MTKKEPKLECSWRYGCNKDGVFECVLGGMRTVLRCEEHAKRKYFLSNDVLIKRIGDPDDEYAQPRDVIGQDDAVPAKKFGKDHWSLLAYVEIRCTDHGGQLDGDHLRVNPKTHPRHPVKSFRATYAGADGWKPDYGTRLHGYWSKDGKRKLKSRKLDEHDDLDCLEDLEAAGYIKIHNLVEGVVEMTDAGNKMAARLREHKKLGGQFAEFSL